MKKVNKQLKRHLDKELEHIHFSRQQDVLNKIKHSTWNEKLHRIWNKEISIPLLPVSTAFIILIAAISYVELSPMEQIDNENQNKKLIQVAGNYYWKDDFERALLKNEN
ncbi:hypothetical protein [Paucisalibacillus sp. EB02]|uniref:hypothetical protein n=1 Tax=Paucisalibacillus sp. EB02 TaxID=1347087 RepID=UPI0005AAE51F|nr:hypothetical protein [Paucisalibacillus sp. EB02]